MRRYVVTLSTSARYPVFYCLILCGCRRCTRGCDRCYPEDIQAASSMAMGTYAPLIGDGITEEYIRPAVIIYIFYQPLLLTSVMTKIIAIYVDSENVKVKKYRLRRPSSKNKIFFYLARVFFVWTLRNYLRNVLLFIFSNSILIIDAKRKKI